MYYLSIITYIWSLYIIFLGKNDQLILLSFSLIQKLFEIKNLILIIIIGGFNLTVSIIQAIPSILAIVVCIIILIFLSLNYLLNRFIPSILFILFFIGMLLWSVTKLVSVLLPYSADRFTFMFYWKIGSLTILILSLLVITYFRDLLSYATLSFPSVIISFFAGITIGALWWGGFVTVAFDAVSGWNTDYDTWFLVILLIYLVLVYVFMFSLLISGIVKAKVKKQKQQLAFIITGLAIAAIGGTIINFILNIAFPTLGDMDLIFVVLGFAIVAIAYLRSPIQIYFAPVVARRLIVMNNDGIPLLSHDFCDPTEEALKMDSTLISGALSGIINILKEALMSESIPSLIHLEDRVLLLQKSKSALYALIADDDSMALQSALKDFSKEFETHFGDELENWGGLTDIFNDAYKLIIEDFSFVLTSAPEREAIECDD